MAYTEIRDGVIRVRWKLANGKYSGGSVNEETGEPFTTEDEARQYGKDQETLIRLGLRKEKQKSITFREWTTTWYAGQALELSTMANYAHLIRAHLMHVWGNRDLDSIAPEEMDPWERSIVAAGYAPRTARDARSMLITILADAVPHRIPINPALRRRGKGKKGLRRIEAFERASKVWPTPFDVVLLAERIALLSGQDDDFVAMVTKGFTGMRWSELLALTPPLTKNGVVDLQWKVYELNGHFYWGRPKDGSIRQVHLPPFLDRLLATVEPRRCSCGSAAAPYCSGRTVLFLGSKGGHHRRSDFARRFMRPAADGFYPGQDRGGTYRLPVPVLADASSGWPGEPLPPWPAALPGVEFTPPKMAGYRRRAAGIGVNARSRRPELVAYAVGQGMAPEAAQALSREELLDRYVRVSYTGPGAALVSWLPVRQGLTPHGLRHGHQTLMDDAGIKLALKKERMGHEDLTMSGVYGHVTDGMIAELMELLTGVWETALQRRAELSPRSAVGVLDAQLAPYRDGAVTGLATRRRRGA